MPGDGQKKRQRGPRPLVFAGGPQNQSRGRAPQLRFVFHPSSVTSVQSMTRGLRRERHQCLGGDTRAAESKQAPFRVFLTRVDIFDPGPHLRKRPALMLPASSRILLITIAPALSQYL